MKANKFFIVAAAVFTVLFAVVLWADELTNRVDFVSKQLGCEFPYMVAENSETGGFYAEAKLKNPQRLKAQGFPDAESDYVVSIQESLPGEYWVKVVPEHRMLDAAEEKLIVVEYKTTSQSPASQSPPVRVRPVRVRPVRVRPVRVRPVRVRPVRVQPVRVQPMRLRPVSP